MSPGEARDDGRDSAAYLAAIVESTDDAILSKSLDGVIQSCNRAAERLFGYTAAELIGKPVTLLIPRERLKEEEDILARLCRGERIDHFETVRVAKDGRLLDLSLTISPVRDASGKVIGASKIARDITEQKRAAEALEAQREWYRVTLESIGDAVITLDPSGNVVSMNPVAEHLTGWTASAARDHHCADVFQILQEGTRQPIEDPVSRVLKSGAAVRPGQAAILVAANGTERPIEDWGAPIRDRSGHIVGVVLVFRDMSQRRRAEEERYAQARELEQLYERERTARSEAEKANRAKDEFLAMVSHELRTPLTAILGWTHILQNQQPDDSTLRHGLEVVRRNAHAQAQLVSDLLDIGRITAGKLALDVGSIDLLRVIEDSIETLQHAADDARVEIRRRLDPGVGTIVGDPSRLQQIVWNLLSNAIKFTPPDGVVMVELRRTPQFAVMTISDTGQGIRREHMAGLFERFQQGSPTTTRKHGGLGLGLAIVKHLVTLHGGTITASSEGEGRGATFTVELPLTAARPKQAPAGPWAAAEPAFRAEDVSLAKVSVLVVEDDTDTRELIARILENYGARVTAVSSAHRALEILESICPDVLLSDLGLPGMDGYELIRRVRLRGESHARMPAVALTAFARAEDRTVAMRAGFQSHIAKPVDPTELVVTIASLAGLAGTSDG